MKIKEIKMTLEKLKLLGWLFKTDMFISSFTFGGGYVVLPMIRKYFVDQKHLFSEDELMDMAAVAQSSPGAIAINLAVLCGKRVAGWPGILVAGIGAVLPPLIILSIVSAYYKAMIANETIAALLKGMEAGVAALIADVVWYMSSMIAKNKEPLPLLMIPAVFAANFIFNVNALLAIFGGLIFFGLVSHIKFKIKVEKAETNV